MRDDFPLMAIIGELSEVLQIKKEKPKIFCTVFEDNNGALELANTPRLLTQNNAYIFKVLSF